MVGLPYKVQATKRYGGERAAPCNYLRGQEVFSSDDCAMSDTIQGLIERGEY